MQFYNRALRDSTQFSLRLSDTNDDKGEIGELQEEFREKSEAKEVLKAKLREIEASNSDLRMKAVNISYQVHESRQKRRGRTKLVSEGTQTEEELTQRERELREYIEIENRVRKSIEKPIDIESYVAAMKSGDEEERVLNMSLIESKSDLCSIQTELEIVKRMIADTKEELEVLTKICNQ